MATAKEITDRALAAWRDRDVEGGVRLVAEDARMSLSGGVELVGPDGWRQFNELWNTAFPDNELTIHAEHLAGPIVVWEGTFSGTHTGDLRAPDGQVIPPTGRRLDGRYCGIVTVERDRIVRYALYYDQMDIMTQLGLLPPVGAGAGV